MKDKCMAWFRKRAKIAPLFLRLAIGVIFMVHGYGKLVAIDGTAGFFGSIGYPIPGFFAVFVGLVELLAGASLLAGFFTRCAASLLAIVMVFAILTVKIKLGFSAMEIDLALLGGNLALLFLGSSFWALKKD